MAVKEKTNGEMNENKFSKEQILSSKKYNNRRDALSVILDNDEYYEIAEVDKLLSDFMKGKVN